MNSEKNLPKEIIAKIIRFQRDEITSACIYEKLASKIKDENNKKVLIAMAKDERQHYQKWEKITGEEIKPAKGKVRKFFFLAKILGLTFAVKFLEKGEDAAQVGYASLSEYIPDIQYVIDQENAHEGMLINMLDEERLKYAGSMVLGLNDALVELTGSLAGFTFAFANPKMVALTGLITGISAAFSMASSEYLSQRSEPTPGVSAVKSAVYTGITYLVAVILLVLPFFCFNVALYSLAVTLCIVVLIILAFNYYICIAKDMNFKRHFLEMLIVSLSVTVLSFGVGVIVKNVFGLDV